MASGCGWKLEEVARSSGALRIAGLDEVGRGPLFGPVVAAAVILPKDCCLQDLTDSKQLSEKKREQLDVQIRARAVAYAIAAVDAETIDRINIRRASLEAMRRAVEQLALSPYFLAPDFLLIDGRDTIEWNCPQRAVIQGDALSFSIAAADSTAIHWKLTQSIRLRCLVGPLCEGICTPLGANRRSRRPNEPRSAICR